MSTRWNTSIAIWDDFISRAMLTLKSKPKGWDRKENNLPEGEWIIAYGMHPMASDSVYQNFGVRKPAFEELPVVFSVNSFGQVEERCRVTADQAAEFINERI